MKYQIRLENTRSFFALPLGNCKKKRVIMDIWLAAGAELILFRGHHLFPQLDKLSLSLKTIKLIFVHIF